MYMCVVWFGNVVVHSHEWSISIWDAVSPTCPFVCLFVCLFVCPFVHCQQAQGWQTRNSPENFTYKKVGTGTRVSHHHTSFVRFSETIYEPNYNTRVIHACVIQSPKHKPKKVNHVGFRVALHSKRTLFSNCLK